MDDNIHNLRDALEWLDRRIREEAELDGEMSNDHANQLGFITNMLEKFPLRNCDVGTAEEQVERYCRHCQTHCISCEHRHACNVCGERYRLRCFARWAQLPYGAEEEGAK